MTAKRKSPRSKKREPVGKAEAPKRPPSRKASAPPKEPKGEVSPAARAKTIGEMKSLLFERRETLRGGMEQSLDAYHAASPVARGDASDLAADSLDSDTALQLAESGASELAQIDEALRKIEEGTYGQCESCGGEIPWTRLEALPYATLCIECKRRQELIEAGGGAAAGWSAVDDLEQSDKE